jgi:hypothetical protein
MRLFQVEQPRSWLLQKQHCRLQPGIVITLFNDPSKPSPRKQSIARLHVAGSNIR